MSDSPPPAADPAPEPSPGDSLAPLPIAQADQAVQRRSFLGLCTAGLGACAGLGVLGAVGAAVVGTPLGATGAAGQWLDLGPLERFSDGAALKVPAVAERRDAWNRFEPRSLGSIVVIREGQTIRAFSARCPHNGCAVFVSKTELVCPCHDSRFGLSGAQIQGESPRDLDPLDARVEEGRVRVLYQRFQDGIAERKPV